MIELSQPAKERKKGVPHNKTKKQKTPIADAKVTKVQIQNKKGMYGVMYVLFGYNCRMLDG